MSETGDAVGVTVGVTVGTGGFDGARIVAELNELLRLRSTPVAMKRFETIADMEAVPKLRRPSAIHTMDQVIGQACRNGWTVGVTKDDLVGDQSAAVAGLHPRDDEWLEGKRYAGVWYATEQDGRAPIRGAARSRCDLDRPVDIGVETVDGGVDRRHEDPCPDRTQIRRVLETVEVPGDLGDEPLVRRAKVNTTGRPPSVTGRREIRSPSWSTRTSSRALPPMSLGVEIRFVEASRRYSCDVGHAEPGVRPRRE